MWLSRRQPPAAPATHHSQGWSGTRCGYLHRIKSVYIHPSTKYKITTLTNCRNVFLPLPSIHFINGSAKKKNWLSFNFKAINRDDICLAPPPVEINVFSCRDKPQLKLMCVTRSFGIPGSGCDKRMAESAKMVLCFDHWLASQRIQLLQPDY